MKLAELTETTNYYPLPKDVKKYVASNYYVYNDDDEWVQIEDRAEGVKAKFTIEYGPNILKVYANDFVDDKRVQKREHEIYLDILNNAHPD